MKDSIVPIKIRKSHSSYIDPLFLRKGIKMKIYLKLKFIFFMTEFKVKNCIKQLSGIYRVSPSNPYK